MDAAARTKTPRFCSLVAITRSPVVVAELMNQLNFSISWHNWSKTGKGSNIDVIGKEVQNHFKEYDADKKKDKEGPWEVCHATHCFLRDSDLYILEVYWSLPAGQDAISIGAIRPSEVDASQPS